MNSKSLDKELKNLKHYLKETKSLNETTDKNQKKIITYTLVGMIMSLYNLIKTGAYDEQNKSELFKITEEARNTAIHYGYFNDFNNIYPAANQITNNIPSHQQTHFAQIIKSSPPINHEYCQIYTNENTEIKPLKSMNDFIVFSNKKTGEELYVKKEDLIIVENKLNNKLSYLLRISDENVLFYKDNQDSTTIKISFNKLMKSNFFAAFKTDKKTINLDDSINKLLSELNQNPYRNLVVRYRYDNKITSITIHNLLKQFLYERRIDEKVLRGNFYMSDYDKPKTSDKIDLKSINTKDTMKKATLRDILYIELFLKRYRVYSQIKEEMDNNSSKLAHYTKQAILTNLYTIGAASFSAKFINADKSGRLSDFYYNYRNTRNELAHFATSNIEDKEILLTNLEKYSDACYSFLSKIYSQYLNEKSKNPKFNLPEINKEDKKQLVIHNKTSKYVKFKHLGLCKIIDGKKYLKLDLDKKNVYVEFDKAILSLDYNTMISRDCVVSYDGIRFYEIDCNTNHVTQTKIEINQDDLIHVDDHMDTILQAHDLLKNHPLFNKTIGAPCISAITYYDNSGNAIYTEGIKNMLYRRYAQKMCPSKIIEASSLIVPKDRNEPITILNKNKVIVAKVYLACVNYIDGKEVITQLLTNKKQKEVDYGRLLPKDLKTNEVITTTKEVRR